MSLTTLRDAVSSLNAADAFKPRLTMDQWLFFGAFLTQHTVRGGDLLLEEGKTDRTMYLLEEGALQVYLSKPKPGQRLSILRAGALVGEAGLFSEQARMANVEAMGPCVVWALSGQRYEELVARSPAIALEVVRAAAAVMGVRMRANMQMREAVS
jgi:CRP-like cAMP-binding protein